MKLRVGTRGSELALTQTRWVCAQLRQRRPTIDIEELVIKTHGDEAIDARFGPDWPAGAFVSAIENALLDGRIDFAVHSHKDLQTAETPGLTIAAIPPRENPQDVLVARQVETREALPPGARIGTSSPRRAAQLRQLGEFEIVPIRGNVPTRIAKLEKEDLDGVVLAAAGLARLGLQPSHAIALPIDVFLPAPAQGALAIQTRVDGSASEALALLDDAPTRVAVVAERAFLAAVNAGCHAPVAAYAIATQAGVELHAKLFSVDETRRAEGRRSGDDPARVGAELGEQLLAELQRDA